MSLFDFLTTIYLSKDRIPIMRRFARLNPEDGDINQEQNEQHNNNSQEHDNIRIQEQEDSQEHSSTTEVLLNPVEQEHNTIGNTTKILTRSYRTISSYCS